MLKGSSYPWLVAVLAVGIGRTVNAQGTTGATLTGPAYIPVGQCKKYTIAPIGEFDDYNYFLYDDDGGVNGPLLAFSTGFTNTKASAKVELCCSVGTGPGGTNEITGPAGGSGESSTLVVAQVVAQFGEAKFTVESPPLSVTCGRDPNTQGDPHFRTWSGLDYDFHGQCDLVLLQNPTFGEHQQGMDIHVRTEIEHWWSFVKTAGVRIGNDILEVQGHHIDEVTGQNRTERFWINGKQLDRETDLPAKIDKYTVRYMERNDDSYSNSSNPAFAVLLGQGQRVLIRLHGKFLRVTVNGATTRSFAGSRGLFGSFETGDMIARDGETLLNMDPVQFGLEWQVRSTEPQLFHHVSKPQHPETCIMPSEAMPMRRFLRMPGMIHPYQAEIACASAPMEDQDNCIKDVLLTNDLAMAEAY